MNNTKKYHNILVITTGICKKRQDSQYAHCQFMREMSHRHTLLHASHQTFLHLHALNQPVK